MSNARHETITRWLAQLETSGKSSRTVANYSQALTHFARWSEQRYGERFEPAAIIPRDVVEWKSFQQVVEKAKPATINLRLTALSRYFKWAAGGGLVRRDPASEVGQLRLEKRQPRALSEGQVRRLLRQVNRAGVGRDRALIELMLGAGLRVSEVLALRVSDVTLNERSGQVVVRQGKGGQRRTVPLVASARAALRGYLEELAAGADLPAEGPLWPGGRGPLRNRSSVLYLLKKYARQAGLDERLVSPHVLRHTFATRYLAANPGDLRGLAALLGHASLNTVLIYTEPTTEALAQRLEAADDQCL